MVKVYKTNALCEQCKKIRPRLKQERHGIYKGKWTCFAKWNEKWKACSQEMKSSVVKELFDGMF